MCTGKALVSSFLSVAMPLRPLRIPSQTDATELPSGETMPSPVTTTLRFVKLRPLGLGGLGMRCDRPPWRCRIERSGLAAALVDVVDRLLDGGDLLGVLVRDLRLELFLERHHELDGIERVGAEIVDEGRIVG